MIKIILSIIAIISVGTSAYVINNNLDITVPDNKIDENKINNMEESEFVDAYFNMNFINKDLEDFGFTNYYIFRISSADSIEDAIEKTKTTGISYNNIIQILKLNLQEETDYYYVICQEYVYNKKQNHYYYLYFKNSILDIDNETINTSIFNNANKVKEIFDLYMHISNKHFKKLPSEITENSNEYIYTCYYFSHSTTEQIYGNIVSLNKITIRVNKESGKYEYNTKVVRSVVYH